MENSSSTLYDSPELVKIVMDWAKTSRITKKDLIDKSDKYLDKRTKFIKKLIPLKNIKWNNYSIDQIIVKFSDTLQCA